MNNPNPLAGGRMVIDLEPHNWADVATFVVGEDEVIFTVHKSLAIYHCTDPEIADLIADGQDVSLPDVQPAHLSIYATFMYDYASVNPSDAERLALPGATEQEIAAHAWEASAQLMLLAEKVGDAEFISTIMDDGGWIPFDSALPSLQVVQITHDMLDAKRRADPDYANAPDGPAEVFQAYIAEAWAAGMKYENFMPLINVFPEQFMLDVLKYTVRRRDRG